MKPQLLLKAAKALQLAKTGLSKPAGLTPPTQQPGLKALQGNPTPALGVPDNPSEAAPTLH